MFREYRETVLNFNSLKKSKYYDHYQHVYIFSLHDNLDDRELKKVFSEIFDRVFDKNDIDSFDIDNKDMLESGINFDILDLESGKTIDPRKTITYDLSRLFSKTMIIFMSNKNVNTTLINDLLSRYSYYHQNICYYTYNSQINLLKESFVKFK
jgi:hypothetical protein